jgi:hypothetical protein
VPVERHKKKKKKKKKKLLALHNKKAKEKLALALTEFEKVVGRLGHNVTEQLYNATRQLGDLLADDVTDALQTQCDRLVWFRF